VKEIFLEQLFINFISYVKYSVSTFTLYYVTSMFTEHMLQQAS